MEMKAREEVRERASKRLKGKERSRVMNTVSDRGLFSVLSIRTRVTHGTSPRSAKCPLPTRSIVSALPEPRSLTACTPYSASHSSIIQANDFGAC